MSKIKVLTFAAYYLPGYKGGGPVRTIENMASHLNEEIEFWIVTRDRDLGDTVPYSSIESNSWQRVGHAYVYYLPPEGANFKGVSSVIDGTHHDVVYLNSFFDQTFSIYPLMHRFIHKSSKAPYVLAPRGEFAKAAIAINSIKKTMYLWLCSFFGLTNNVVFQASSEYEREDIKRVLNIHNKDIKVASDLPPKESALTVSYSQQLEKSSEAINVIFLSRISAMKNLDFAIKVLKHVRNKVNFDIYGPKEDLVYWAQCEELIEQLPKNIKVQYCGNVLPENVKNTFARYDLFFFPTRGENYGHVISESISAGTPILLSDRTPWRTLDEDDLGWVLSLDELAPFAKRIDTFAQLSYSQRQEKRFQILAFAQHRLCDPKSVQQNRQLFLSLVTASS